MGSKIATQIEGNIREIQREQGVAEDPEPFGNLDEPANVFEAADSLGVPLSRLMAGLVLTPSDEQPMTVPEMAAYLRRSEYTVREYAKTGEIPAHKVGREWRFFMSEVRAAWKDRAAA